jgi:DNA/RNA-binding domain of Phe-tRNA-synthetase-like protein
MTGFPLAVEYRLDGWRLEWSRLVPSGSGGAAVTELRAEIEASTRKRFAGTAISEDPVVVEVRRLFRAAGCDPTRYRPSSEALIRRLVKGDALPAISPLVDLNNCLSIELLLPCCVVDAGALEPPLELRAGGEEERMESLRGPFRLAGKPVLADRRGPFGTPITDSERVRITDATKEAWMVVYLPSRLADRVDVGATLQRLLERAPVADLLDP